MALVNISKSEESRNEIKNKEGLQAILQAIYRPSTGFFSFFSLFFSFLFSHFFDYNHHILLFRKHAISSP